MNNIPTPSLDERIQCLNALIRQRRIEARRRSPHPGKLMLLNKRIEFYRGWIELDPYLYSSINREQVRRAVEALHTNPYTG